MAPPGALCPIVHQYYSDGITVMIRGGDGQVSGYRSGDRLERVWS